MDWLTWQGIRALADVEVAKDHDRVRYIAPVAQRSYPIVLGRSQPLGPDVPVPAHGIVFVRDAWRAPWRASLAAIPQPCVLVTVFNDAHVRPHATAGLLEGTRIAHWFAVQVETEHPRLTAMPIGIDGRDVPTLVAAPRRPWAARDVPVLANFQPRTSERKAVLAQCRTQAWMQTETWVSTQPPHTLAEYYARLGRTRFVLSPPGRGWDCYRTYEALAMGAVPIVRRQPPISDVVDGLPVLVVDDWREVTRARLEAYVPPAEWNLERMTLPYWQERIRAMGRTNKARTEAYDNIAVGSAISTRERTISGALPPATTTWGNTENIQNGTDYSADENLVVAGTNLLAIERLTP